jgi:hypothetical protein
MPFAKFILIPPLNLLSFPSQLSFDTVFYWEELCLTAIS